MKLWIAKMFLRLNGWKSVGHRPAVRKCVLIAAPHTSNWDLAYALAFAKVFDVRIQWVGKHTLFFWPLGWLMRSVGGLSVRRDVRQDHVKQMAGLFDPEEDLMLMVPAEGTRAYAPYWKSGFYHIARTAGVPIIATMLDYGTKRAWFGEPIYPSDNIKQDMDKIRAGYAGCQGKFPAKFSPIRLKDEDRQIQ